MNDMLTSLILPGVVILLAVVMIVLWILNCLGNKKKSGFHVAPLIVSVIGLIIIIVSVVINLGVLEPKPLQEQMPIESPGVTETVGPEGSIPALSPEPLQPAGAEEGALDSQTAVEVPEEVQNGDAQQQQAHDSVLRDGGMNDGSSQGNGTLPSSAENSEVGVN